MVNEKIYEEWIASRLAAEPSSTLPDRVMLDLDLRVQEREVQEREVQIQRSVRLADRMNQSQPVRWVACGAALLVGCLPFLFVAYVAELHIF